jgi:hypothetical protein
MRAAATRGRQGRAGRGRERRRGRRHRRVRHRSPGRQAGATRTRATRARDALWACVARSPSGAASALPPRAAPGARRRSVFRLLGLLLTARANERQKVCL